MQVMKGIEVLKVHSIWQFIITLDIALYEICVPLATLQQYICLPIVQS